MIQFKTDPVSCGDGIPGLPIIEVPKCQLAMDRTNR